MAVIPTHAIKFTICVWDVTLCAPSRVSMLFTGLSSAVNHVTGNGKSGQGVPQDGSAYTFNYTAGIGGQLYNNFTTLVKDVPAGAVAALVLAPTAIPLLLDSGSIYPGGKVQIGSDTFQLNPSSFPFYTSKTNPTVVPLAGGSTATSSYAAGTPVGLQAYFPQQFYMCAETPALWDSTWDYSQTIPWYMNLAGFQVNWHGKILNGYPWLRGDTYVPKVGGVNFINGRFTWFLDDQSLDDQTNPSNNAYEVGKPYSGIDHRQHLEADYLGRTGFTFNFNDQGVGNYNNAPAAGDSWTSSTSGTAPFAPFTILNATNSGANITATIPAGIASTLVFGQQIYVTGAAGGTWSVVNGPQVVTGSNSGTNTFTFTTPGSAPTGTYTASSGTVVDQFVGALGYTARQAAVPPGGIVGATAYISDYWSRQVFQWLRGLDTTGGLSLKTPFFQLVTPRGDHAAWCAALRHQNITPSGTPGLQIGVLDTPLAGGSSTLSWSNMPAITGRDTSRGIYVMIGAEPCKVTATSGTVGSSGTWTLTRDIFGDNAATLLQAGGASVTWPVNSPVVLLSSRPSADVGDDPSFNFISPGDSPFWGGMLNVDNDPMVISTATAGGTGNLTITIHVPFTSAFYVGETFTIASASGGTWSGINGTQTVSSIVDDTHLTFQVSVAPTGTYSGNSASVTAKQYGLPLSINQCAQARRDRVLKAKTGMAVDEMIFDLNTFCNGNAALGVSAAFSNPTVIIIISDNGWEYGGHAQAKGKITPYKLAQQGPIYIIWPANSTASQFPYFPTTPNIILVVTDDDDAESLSSGYPLLNAMITKVESACVTSNLDIPATVLDLAGAIPTRMIDGVSLAPYASGALSGRSPRTFAFFRLLANQENGMPTMYGIRTVNQAYWEIEDYTVPPTAITSGPTTAQAPIGVYPRWVQAYDYTGQYTGFADPDEIYNSAPNPGYTPPHPMPEGVLNTLRSRMTKCIDRS